MIELMKEHTTLTRPQGRYMIRCNKGLWSVDGNIRHRVENEALHYFQQYWSDGEYDESISDVERVIKTTTLIKNNS